MENKYHSYQQKFRETLAALLDDLKKEGFIRGWQGTGKRGEFTRYQFSIPEFEKNLVLIPRFHVSHAHKFTLKEGKIGIVFVDYGILFSSADGVLLKEKIRRWVTDCQAGYQTFLEVLSELVYTGLLRSYQRVPSKNYQLAYTLKLSDLPQTLLVVPSFLSPHITKSKKLDRRQSDGKLIRHLTLFSTTKSRELREELIDWVQTHRKGFLLEKKFTEAFAKRQKYSDFLIVEKTTEKEESLGYGDFRFTFLGPVKIYVDIKSSETGVLSFLQDGKMKRKSDGYVIPLNYQQCLDKGVHPKVIEDYLRDLAKNPDRLKGMSFKQFLNDQKQKLFF
ncbi:hypothetical protein KC929_02625 [Patescibacteria group bacterium]|nr:hypothetical protein [Patescibacteria group bacterium]